MTEFSQPIRFLIVSLMYNNTRVYLKDSNAAAHSVDSDIFYVVINPSARSKSYIITFISLVSNCVV